MSNEFSDRESSEGVLARSAGEMAERASVIEAHELIMAAKNIAVLSGAGISTDSGIPDFRGPQGVWTKNPAAEKQANLANWMSDPEMRRNAWRNRVQNTKPQPQPNAGHRALVELEKQGRLHTLVTQNVDGLHLAAGHSPEKVVEVHGTIREAVCMSCGDRMSMESAIERVRNGEEDLACYLCGGIIKSATISFGQSLEPESLMRAELAAERCDLLLAVGTTLTVFPINEMAPLAVASGAKLVVVNGEETAFDHIADAVVRQPISTVLPQLVTLLA